MSSGHPQEPQLCPNPMCARRRLSDVHMGLPPSGVPGGTLHMVDGGYEYYHYMQVRAPATPCLQGPLQP